MDTLIIVIPALALFFLAYRFYAKRLEGIWEIDPKRETPAYTRYDKIDYIPAKNWLVLFGHHFASIAGAAPVIGPVIAVILWGWLPALLWVVFGTIFIGGVHDFGSLITSVREGGSSIAEIAEGAISRRAKVIFSLFVWLALILVISVFAYLCAQTFVSEPEIVLPSLGLIPIAIIVGLLLYYFRANTVLTTIFGLMALAGLMILGNLLPIKADIRLWLWVLFIYCFVASIAPVNILLQPRDYLSSFLLFFGIGAGYIGLFLSHPPIVAPYYRIWTTTEGSLWPMLFVTIACGAISGFHALIASGTTSKQISNEAHIKRIGYGAMIAEGLIALLAIIVVAILFRQGEDADTALKSLGPIGTFGRGYNLITGVILGRYGLFIAITILNAFILTTLDTATRIARYLTEELFKIQKRYLSTLLIIILSAILAFSGKWNKIWPAFGASNQLVAALALFIISCWLLAKDKNIKFTIIPASFMLITTVSGLISQLMRYLKQGDILLFIITIFLIILAGFMLYEIVNTIKKIR